MPLYLRQSTASQEVPLGPFVDSTDAVTAETGLTIANTDIKVWKAGATTLANKNSDGATHVSGGIYYAVLDATDTDTIGPLVLFVAVSGALAVRVECVVLDEAVYDVLFGTAAPLVAGTNSAATSFTAGVTISNASGSALTLSSSGGNGSGLRATGNGTGDGMYVQGGATGNGAEFIGGSTSGQGLWCLAVGSGHGLQADGATDGAGISATGAGTRAGVLATGGATDAAGIKCQGTLSAAGLSCNGGTTGAGIRAVGGTTSGDGLITSVTSGHGLNLVAAGLNKHGLLATGGTSGTCDGVKAVAGTGGVPVRGDLTGSITGNLSGSVGSVATGGITASSFAAGAIDAAAVAADAGTEIATAVWASGTRTLTSLDEDTTTLDLDATVRAAVGLATANLDTQLTAIDDYLDTEVAAIKAKTDNLPTDPADASDIAAAFTTVNTTLATIAAYIDTEVAAIKAKTDNLPSDPADASDIAASFSSLASTLSTIAGYIDTEVAAIKAKTDQLAFTTANRVDCQVFGLENNTVTAAALATDAGSEIATAVTAKDLGNGRTVAYYLKGGANKIVFASNGLSFTVYDTDDTTTLYTGTSTRLATSVGGLLSIDPS